MSTAEERRATAAALTLHTARIAELATDLQYARQPEVWERYGVRGRELSVRDMTYHLPFLGTAIVADEPRVFADYVAWIRHLFARLGFEDPAAAVLLACMRDAIAEALPGGLGAVAVPYIEAGVAELAAPLRRFASFLEDDGHPLRPLARLYLDALLKNDRAAARTLVLDAVARGVGLREVLLRVLQDVQREVGRLWFSAEISVAREHYCTAVTQDVIAHLYPRIMDTPRVGRRIVVACAAGESHDLGARMVADFFELAGWDAVFLGRDTPTAALAEAVREHRPDVLGVSANMSFHFPAVRDGIAAARRADPTGRLRVLVGGYQFDATPGLWTRTGADGSASDADAAVATAEALVAAVRGQGVAS